MPKPNRTQRAKRRKLGQHYLVDEEAVRSMVRTAEIRTDERVLEIGTGRGTLTKELVGLGRTFEGYEVDRENYENTVAAVGGAGIHLGDAFEQRPDFDVMVASLPYSRSAAFIEWLSRLKYRRAVVLLQEDFVRKITAAPGTREYRAVSALAQISADIRAVRRVARESFYPPPRVSSMIVSIEPKVRMSVPEISNIKRLFSLRRRRVASVLAELGMESGREDYGNRRVYSLSPEEVHRLCSSGPGA